MKVNFWRYESNMLECTNQYDNGKLGMFVNYLLLFTQDVDVIESILVSGQENPFCITTAFFLLLHEIGWGRDRTADSKCFCTF